MHPRADDYAEFPYPGERPRRSYVLDPDGRVIPTVPDPDQSSGWRIEGRDLDAWLSDHGAAPLDERIAVLSYGSNANPQKVLRNRVGLPAVQLAADVVGLAAVWCAGTRHLDGAVPATVAPVHGHRERHFLSYVLPQDLPALDSVEGHPLRYRRQVLDRGRVVREDGLEPDAVLAYVGVSAERLPVLDASGEAVPVRAGLTAEDAQARARVLVEQTRVVR